MELNVMDEVFCTDRRTTPLKVGSVKSNIGHGEPAGLFMSIIKAVIALDSGYIPPNINYARPNENVKALKTGKIQVSEIGIFSNSRLLKLGADENRQMRLAQPTIRNTTLLEITFYNIGFQSNGDYLQSY